MRKSSVLKELLSGIENAPRTLMPILTEFALDPERLAVLKDCIDDYGVAEDENAEWPNNILSRRTVVYGNGTIAREGDSISFRVDSEELDLCIRLANEAAAIMEGEPVGMGSESGAGFSAFWICANGEDVPTEINENLIRTRFSNTIFPLATIDTESLSENSEVFAPVIEDVEAAVEDDPENAAQYQDTLEKWRALIRWFAGNPHFTKTAFIAIGNQDELWELSEDEYPPGTEMTPSVLPRLILGLTHNGSLCGLFGFVVQT